MCSLERAVCVFSDCINPVCLGGILLELLYNQYLMVLWHRLFTCKGKKEGDDGIQFVPVKYFPIGDNARQ